MAGGTYRFSVLWRDVEVFNGTVSITTNGPYTLSLRIYALAVSVVDDVGDGISLAQVVVTNHTTGLVADSKLTNLAGIAQTRLPVGSYDFTVYWRNVLIFDSLTDHLVNASGTLVLQAGVYEVDLLVVDSIGLPLAGARIVVGFAATNQVHDFGTTNVSGGLVTKLPVGYYDFWVYWKDVLVNFTDDLWVDAGDAHTIVAAVYWVNVTILDARNVAVTSALVTMRHQDGLDFGTKVTDDMGNVTYQVPIGSYDVDVSWKESPVYSGTHLIDSNAPIVLNVAIYYLDLTVEDTLSIPIEAAMVTVTNASTGDSMGSHSTDTAGNATFRLPVGDYDLLVVWQESPVYRGRWRVDANLQLVLTASVYYARYHLVDSRAAPVEGASVTISNASTGRIMGSPVSDADGNITLRVPEGIYDVLIVWQETEVFQAVRAVDSNDPAVLVVAIFYVDLHVQDTTNVALAGAMVTFTNATTGRSMGSRVTDAGGNVSYRVPVGTYTLVITWEEASVHESLETVDADRALLVTASVYYADLRVVDTTDEALSGAQVTVTNVGTGRIMGSRTTDADGRALLRLPMDNYTVLVVWQETVVYNVTSVLDINDLQTIVAYVFYATIDVVDSQDAPLSAAFVTLTNSTSGRPMGDRITAGDGRVVLRLPGALYDVEILWQDIIVHQGTILVDTNDPFTIQVMVYYPTFNLADARGEPLEGALVTVTMVSNNRIFGSLLSDAQGSTTFHIPVGTYDITIVWMDTVVYQATHVIEDNEPHDLAVMVYYHSFEVVDSREVPVEGALVTMVQDDGGELSTSLVTPATGEVTFRLPVGTYMATIVWMDTIVHEAVYVADDNADHYIVADVFYVLFRAQDSREVGLEHAQIVVTNSTTQRAMGGHTASPEGETTYRLPIGEYEVEVRWQQSLVYLDTWFVDADATDILECWVYYVGYHVVDASDIDLPSGPTPPTTRGRSSSGCPSATWPWSSPGGPWWSTRRTRSPSTATPMWRSLPGSTTWDTTSWTPTASTS
jgi:hypothetical protein